VSVKGAGSVSKTRRFEVRVLAAPLGLFGVTSRNPAWKAGFGLSRVHPARRSTEVSESQKRAVFDPFHSLDSPLSGGFTRRPEPWAAAAVSRCFTEMGEDPEVTSTTLAAIDPGISTLLLVPLGVLLAVLLCALTLVLALAAGATAMWTLRRASVTVLGSSQDF